ncbi:MAG: InlB B-repeat-containing protein, partial [Treponema sp.]|nr:InlB B-repeat-containing protein [Treponema sp.]
MSKFFIATAAVIAAAGMVLAGCGNLAAGDTFFTVRFEADGGSPAPGDQAVAGNGKATEPAAMTRAGYTFGGWYTEAAFATRWNFATNTVSGDITLYAKWLNPSEALTVTFEADGGSPAPESRAVANGDTAPEPAAMTKAGYSFEGWYRDAAFATPWNFSTDTVGGNITLYAKWAINRYAVTFEADGGDPAPEDQSAAGGGKADEPAAMTKTGYTFGGWYTEAAFATRWNFATDTVNSDITLYARWLNPSEALTVTFEADGGSPAPES